VLSPPPSLPPSEAGSQFYKTVIPGEPNDVGRDPESREAVGNRIILDPPPNVAGDDKLRPSLSREREFSLEAPLRSGAFFAVRQVARASVPPSPRSK
jgi:hypothetical protein